MRPAPSRRCILPAQSCWRPTQYHRCCNNQVLAIGVTSYNGMMYFGINADRDAMSDVDVLPVLLAESLEELIEAAR